MSYTTGSVMFSSSGDVTTIKAACRTCDATAPELANVDNDFCRTDPSARQALTIVHFPADPGLEVLRAGKESDNVIVGGRNRWEYSSFVNWEFWWPAFPILVYFKETQTNPEGQIHFFPIIFNGRQLYEAMSERCGPSKTSGPK
ncbi:hypothetical protein TSOC_002106 [Tetrabaena socialis]|uniref:Uncharacterized protein n=1 Tax=Tetrabaena socialis TaxID=47790 RepID=A0A2J8AEY7_9CHLO|nr:hypothetical protein TSOC_002106 [Tetrabaena socialis]|eukprot:PNH11087.1 hypothetical protein TSOC_002106 [Tetrabaena socialis]